MNEAFALYVTLNLVDNFTRQVFQATQATKDLAKNIEQTQKVATNLQEAFKKAFSPEVVKGFAEKLEDISVRSLQDVAGSLAGITASLKAFEDYEQAKVEMEVAFMTKTGLPQEMEQINKIVDELGQKLPGATADFFRVATALKAAGMSAKDIAEGALKGASYAWVLFKNEVSPEQAAEYMQEFANAFKIPANEFVLFIDQLQKLKYASGLTLTEIAYTTKYISSNLQMLKYTGRDAFEFMASWMGTLKQFGLKGETAGTAIQNVLKAITEFEERAKKVRELGVELRLNVRDFYDETGAFKLQEFLIALRSELMKIQDPIKQAQALKELFDTEGMRAFVPLLAGTKEEALKYLEAIKASLSEVEYQEMKLQIEKGDFTGLEEFARRMREQADMNQRLERMMGTFQNVKESFMGTFTSLLAIVGELFAEPLVKFFNAVNNNVLAPIIGWIQANKRLAQAVALPILALTGLGLAVSAVSLVLASTIKLFAFAITGFKALAGAVLFVKTAFQLLQGALAITKAVGALGMFNPIGLLIFATAGLIVGAGLLIWKNWDRISKALVSAWDWLKESWQRLARLLISVNPFFGITVSLVKVIGYLRSVSLFDAGVKLVRSLWEGIKSLANKPVEAVKEIAQKIRNLLPFSPAKEGPLKDIHRIRLVETIATTIKPEPIVSRLKEALQPIAKIKPPSLQVGIQTFTQGIKQVIAPASIPRVSDVTQKIRQVLIPANVPKIAYAMQNIKQTFSPVKIPEAIQKIKQAVIPANIPKLNEIVQNVKQKIVITPETRARAIVGGTTNVTITVNMGGIQIASATPQEASKAAQQLEKAIREVLAKLEKDRFRRAY